MDVQVIDLKEVLERVQEDKELLLELFDIFEEDYQQKWPHLLEAVKAQQYETIKDLVHSIKGAAGNISAKNLHGACVNLERLAVDKNMAAITAAVPTLEKHFKDLQACMKELRSKYGK